MLCALCNRATKRYFLCYPTIYRYTHKSQKCTRARENTEYYYLCANTAWSEIMWRFFSLHSLFIIIKSEKKNRREKSEKSCECVFARGEWKENGWADFVCSLYFPSMTFSLFVDVASVLFLQILICRSPRIPNGILLNGLIYYITLHLDWKRVFLSLQFQVKDNNMKKKTMRMNVETSRNEDKHFAMVLHSIQYILMKVFLFTGSSKVFPRAKLNKLCGKSGLKFHNALRRAKKFRWVLDAECGGKSRK